MNKEQRLKAAEAAYPFKCEDKGNCIHDSDKESLTSLLTSLGFKQDDNVLILEKI